MLIDETALEPGQLVEQGVKNVQAIHSLVGAKELGAGVYPAAWASALCFDWSPILFTNQIMDFIPSPFLWM